MIAALLLAVVALVLAILLPAPLCLIALAPAAVAGWLWMESNRGRWSR